MSIVEKTLKKDRSFIMLHIQNIFLRLNDLKECFVCLVTKTFDNATKTYMKYHKL